MTPAQIIRQHRDHLVQRLSTDSRMLRFVPGKKGAKETGNIISPHALFDNTNPNPVIVPSAATGKGFCASPDELMRQLLEQGGAATIANVRPETMARCRRIVAVNRDFSRATGNWGLYLAYPLVYWEWNKEKSPYWAPLFFWKINMIPEKGQQLIIDRLKIGGDVALPSFNRLLAARLFHLQNNEIGVPAQWRDEDIPWEDLPEVIKRTLSNWTQCETQYFTDGKLGRFDKDLGGDAPAAAVYPYATLGYGKLSEQSILENLDALAKKSGEMGCMGALVTPVSGETKSNDSQPPPDLGKYLVQETDPSQENAVWQTRNSALTVLQGPPGTGKSQTIANLIADALARDERVAVICHHKPALSVIKNRLAACGADGAKMSDLALLVTDPQSERQEVIKSIRAITDGAPLLNAPTAHETARKESCRTIKDAEEMLDGFCGKFRPQNIPATRRYGALHAAFNRAKEKAGFDIHNPANLDFCEKAAGMSPDEFSDDARKSLKDYLRFYEACDYGNHPWHIAGGDDGGNAHNINSPRVNAVLGQVRDFFKEHGAKEKISMLHRNPAFAEHPLLLRHFAGFAPNPVARKYLQTLVLAHQHLQEVLLLKKISDMFAEFREKGDSSLLQKCLQHIEMWGDFLSAHELKGKNRGMIELISAKCPARGDKWEHYFDAAKAWNIYHDAPKVPANAVNKIETARRSLSGAIGEKRKQDALALVSRFDKRFAASANLKSNRPFLLLTKKGKNPATQLRDIYSKDPRAENMFDIYPVVLATPEAACQMLPLTPGFFDLLVIDEASQVFTSDALPILYRAKRAVISGDEMQMPPSKFFMSADGNFDGGEEEDDDADTPSPNRDSLIPADGVYELLSAVKNTKRENQTSLLVHYRSAARELIDFSNCAFYGNLEIPTGATQAPQFMDGRPIKLVPEKGEFKDGINNAEIRAIIQQLRHVWGSAPDAPKKHSVGVIVFNTHQCNELLYALENENDEFRGWLAQSREFKGDDGEYAGFFVRSVEHVQGDERDIIIMGTTYGNASRNYGPIIKTETGRRRLNVAVSRAKRGMIVVTSLDIGKIASDGDVNKERWFFWKYMEYARAVSKGDGDSVKRVLAELRDKLPDNRKAQKLHATELPENEFEEQVGDFVRECGYDVAYQIGESGFRIDIGVRPRGGGGYFCGVECDGAPYHSSWSARHRDVWRQGILESKGWKIARVWSTEWFFNPSKAKQKLEAALAEAAKTQSVTPQPQ